MNNKIIHSFNLLFLTLSFQAFSQTEDIDADKMREDANKKKNKWYEIVDVKKTDDTFEIMYDITGSDDDEYAVSLVLVRDSDPSFRIVPNKVTGNIGEGSFAGKNNLIVWKYKSDIQKELKGNDYRFDLTVRKIEHSSFPWLWVGLGAVAAGGGAAAVLVLGSNGSADTPPGPTPATAIPALIITRP